MNKLLSIGITSVCLCSFLYPAMAAPTQKSVTTISFEIHPEGKAFFQSESDTVKGYQPIEKGVARKLELDAPAYFFYMDVKQRNHTVYLSPGAEMKIIEKAPGQLEFKGTNSDINDFLNKHPYLMTTPEGCQQYSNEWKQFNQKQLDEKIQALQTSGLPQDFIENQTVYYTCQNISQMVSGPEFHRMFLRTEPELAPGYYDFLKDLKFDNARILLYPKWFTMMQDAFDQMEKQQLIPVSYKNCLSTYAEHITDPAVRSQFIIRYLDLLLQKGYSEEFPAYMQIARQNVNTPAGNQKLNQLEANYQKMAAKYNSIKRGNKAPAFSGVDMNGKSYNSADYAGKIMVLDFWFSGCMPCKAEMPYMEKLADDLKGHDIQFFSLSLDSGKELVNMWKGLVKDKTGETTLQLNIPDGFKSQLAQHFGIRSVPRIVIINQKGEIVDAFARRPSDPKLKNQIEELLGIAPQTAVVTKEECSLVMQQVMKAETATEKEEIMKAFSEKVQQAKADFAYPMLNMMVYQVVRSLYRENHIERADNYVKKMSDSGFKRDLLFLSGGNCMENDQFEIATRLVGEASELTLKLNEGKELSDEEKDKYPVIFGTFAELLIREGKVKEAAPVIRRAYEYGNKNDFSLNKSYAAVLMYEKKYAEALPVLEMFFNQGTASAQHEAWLKEAYTATKGSDKGFSGYLKSMTKASDKQMEEKLKNKMVKEEAPLFSLKNMQGETVALEDLKGKVVILDFWATWCGPCKASFPAMQKAADKYARNKNVVFLFINTLDSKKNLEAEVKKYMNEKGYNFNVLFDHLNPATKESPVFASYKSQGIPAKYIIDKAGNIRFKATGFSGSDEHTVDELSAMIDTLL
ncbi:MAG: TlpA disulfide reductase family protein [Bacteroidales bacterium]